MRSRRSWPLLTLVVAVVATSLGCTRSLEVNYTPSLYRLAGADELRGIVLGVGKLEDHRSWIDRSEPQSQSYVMQAGPWRFGLTYQDKEYMPVADLVQALFVDEFNRAGIEAKAIPAAFTKGDATAMRTEGERLMNTVFRQVVTQVVEQVAAKLAMDPHDIRIRITSASP